MNKDLAIQQVHWEDVSARVHQINPDLATVIDKLNPSKEHHLYLAKYPYGTKIVDNGTLRLPLINKSTISREKLPEDSQIRKDLSYASVPTGLVLNKSFEAYFETTSRIMPSKLYGSGTFFGLWELFDCGTINTKGLWSVSAGARSLFMLPKISDSIAHERLRRDYDVREHAPHSLLEQQAIFQEIANYCDSDWRCEVLFFSRKWIDFDNNNLNSLQLQNYWLRTVWDQSSNCRRLMNYNVSWEIFSREVSRKHLKIRPYITNTIKHLVSISEGSFPAFVPVENDIVAPIDEIVTAYLNTYLLKNYYPILMRPKHLGPGETGYYSFYFPTLLEMAPRSKISGSVISDLKELKRLIELFMLSTGINFKLEFYHTERDKLNEIQHSSAIPIADKRFDIDKFDFPENSPFFRGCIQITRPK